MPDTQESSNKDIVMPHVNRALEQLNEKLPARSVELNRKLSDTEATPILKTIYQDALTDLDVKYHPSFYRYMRFRVASDRISNRRQAFYTALENPDILVTTLTEVINSTTHDDDNDNDFDLPMYFMQQRFCDLNAKLDALPFASRMLYLPVALEEVFSIAALIYHLKPSPDHWDVFNNLLKEHFYFLVKHHEYHPWIDGFVSMFSNALSIAIALCNFLIKYGLLIGVIGLLPTLVLGQDAGMLINFFWFVCCDPKLRNQMIDTIIVLDMKIMSLFNAYHLTMPRYDDDDDRPAFFKCDRHERFQRISDTYLNLFKEPSGTEALNSTLQYMQFYLVQSVTTLVFSVVLASITLPYEILRFLGDTSAYVLFSLKIASALILSAPLYLMDGIAYVQETYFRPTEPESHHAENRHGFFNGGEEQEVETMTCRSGVYLEIKNG